MIKKERLEELLKQGATIYEAYPYDDVEEINLGDTEYFNYEIEKQTLRVENKEFKYLYETKEDAEFASEFSFIEKRFRLNFMTWTQIKEMVKNSYFVENIGYFINDLIYKFCVDKENVYIYTRDFESTQWITLFHKPLTKENYIKACEYARSLFLGDEK